MPDKLDKAGKCLLADVYDIRGGHMEFLTGQLKRVGQGYAQAAIGKVIQTARSLVENRG